MMNFTFDQFPVAADVECRSEIFGRFDRQPAEPDHFIECGAKAARADPADDFEPEWVGVTFGGR